MKKLGVIGSGNMGTTFIRGLLKKQVLPAGLITISDSNSERAEAFCAESGVTISPSNSSLVEESEVIVIAVKPDQVSGVMAEIKPKLNISKILISVALGVSLDKLEKYSGSQARLIRCLPNIPAFVNEGMTCITISPDITVEETELIISYFKAIGEVEFMSEKMLGKITALTSSSPAYIFMFIEAMGDAAVLHGLPRELSYKLAAQAVMGAAKMLRDTKMHPGVLKDMVCSPGGSTIDAVISLEKSGFRVAVIEAMIDCEKKVEKIAKEHNNK